MKIYEIANYFSDNPDGIEAREVLGRYTSEPKAEDAFWALADAFGVSLEEGHNNFSKTTKGLAEDYYSLEEHETDD